VGIASENLVDGFVQQFVDIADDPVAFAMKIADSHFMEKEALSMLVANGRWLGTTSARFVGAIGNGDLKAVANIVGEVGTVVLAGILLDKVVGETAGVNQSGQSVRDFGGSRGFVCDPKGNILIQPEGGSWAGNTSGTFVETRYPNGSPAQQLHGPHKHYSKSHGHGLKSGAGRKMRGESLDLDGNEVEYDSKAAHWDVKE